MKKILIALAVIALSSAGTASYLYATSHAHTTESDLVLGHSGRTDSSGGHNCSAKSKRKGLCSGYHYH